MPTGRLVEVSRARPEIRFMALGPRPYTQKEIDDLIACPKVVSDPPKKEMKPDRGHFRNDMRLESTDGESEFRAFLRRNEDFPESFSIGIVYLPRDGTSEVTLLRCNGPHGEYNESFDPSHPHYDFHVHRANAEMIESGQRPEKIAVASKDFASFEEAVHFFLKTTNIADATAHFADILQQKFPFAQPEPGQ
jgi:hypothetical protein